MICGMLSIGLKTNYLRLKQFHQLDPAPNDANEADVKKPGGLTKCGAVLVCF